MTPFVPPQPGLPPTATIVFIDGFLRVKGGRVVGFDPMPVVDYDSAGCPNGCTPPASACSECPPPAPAAKPTMKDYLTATPEQFAAMNRLPTVLPDDPVQALFSALTELSGPYGEDAADLLDTVLTLNESRVRPVRVVNRAVGLANALSARVFGTVPVLVAAVVPPDNLAWIDVVRQILAAVKAVLDAYRRRRDGVPTS